MCSWEFVTFIACMMAVAYPFWGAIVYGDPWRWVFKDNHEPIPADSNRCVCGCIDLIRYSSLNMKQCPDCKTEIPWHLSDGQLPLVGSNRQDRKLNIDVNDGLVNTPNQTVNKE